MSVADSGDLLREPGERFRFIAQIEQIFPDNSYNDATDKLNLVATAGKYGIIFLACKSQIKAFKTKELVDQSSKAPVSTINCQGSITHIATSCDGLTLFVVAIVNYSPFGFFYDICHSLQTGNEPVPFYSIPLSTSVGARVASLAWNPVDPACIAIAISTGDLSLLKIKETSIEFVNKNDIGANAVTWSAKGKQLAVGKKDATMALFKPDLTFVRSIEAPSIPDIGPIIDITWFTNCEFFSVYLTMNTIPAIMYVNGPKGKPANFVNFEDICYSNENGKPVSYYTKFLSEWNLLFAFSSHGIEMGVIGKTEKDQGDCKWCVWVPDEGARAAMNFYEVKHETFPLGFAVDFTSEKLFPSKDDKPNGPYPFLVTISTKGQLNIFFIENKLSDAQPLTIPCESLPLSGHRTPEQFGQVPAPVQKNSQPEAPQPVELKQNSLSAFSTIAKKSDGVSTQLPLSFSTPVKPASSENLNQGFKSLPQQLFTLPVNTYPNAQSTGSTITVPTLSSSQFSFAGSGASAGSEASKTLFNSQLTSKPVSLSNQIGTTTSLPAPSPQKSEGLNVSLAAIALTKPQNLLPAANQSLTPSVPVTPTTPKVSKDSILLHIQREQQQFDREIAELTSLNDALEYEVGTKTEDAELQTSLENVKKWMKEMKTTTEEQSAEVGHLHQKTLEAMASYEDANSHKETKFKSRNQIYLQLRPLDPYSQRKLKEVRTKYQYLISQIREANTKLDLQWEEYVAFKNPKKYSRDQRSATDNLYRSVLNLHNMRANVEKEIEGTVQQLKKLNLVPIIPLSSFSHTSDSNLEYFSKSLQEKTSPKKSRILKDILSQRVHTPIRFHSVSKASASYSRSVDDKENSPFPPEPSQVLKTTPSVAHSKDVVKNLQYEDISPPTSPPKCSLASVGNPLAALSSLVGNVSVPQSSPQILSHATGVSNLSNIGLKPGAPSSNFYSNLESKVEKAGGFESKESSIPSVSTPSLGSLSAFSAVPSLQGGTKSGFSQPLQPKINFQGFGTMSFSHPASVSGGTLPTSISSEVSQDRSTLAASLSSSTVQNNNTGSLSNILQGNISSGISVSTPSTVATENQGSSFGSLGGLLSSGNMSISGSVKPEPKSSDTLQISTPISGALPTSKENNVLCSNPILSSQILKETSAISANINSPSTSSSFGSFFSQDSASDPKNKQELGLNLKLPTTASDSVTSSSVFAAPASTAPIFGHSSGSSLFGQQSSTPSLFGQTSNTLFVVPSTSIAAPLTQEKVSMGNSLFSQIKAETSSPSTEFSSKPSTVVKSLFSSTQPFQLSSVTTTSMFSQPQTMTTASIFAQTQSPSTSSIFSQLSKNTALTITPTTSTSLFGGQTTTPSSSPVASTTNSKLNFTFSKTTLATSAPVISTVSSLNIPSGQTSTNIFSLNLTSKTCEPSSILGSDTSSVVSSKPDENVKTENNGGPLVKSGELVKDNQTEEASSLDQNEKNQSETQSIFGGSTSGSAYQPFNLSSSSSSAFGQSIFSKPANSSVPSLSVGQIGTTPSIFGQASTSSQSLFGSFSLGSSSAPTSTTTTTTTTTAQSVFGGGSSQTLFGKPASADNLQKANSSSSTPTQSIFGNMGSGSSLQSNSFGSSSVFSQPAAVPSTSSDLNPTSTSAGMNSFFGKTATSSGTSSAFGQPGTTGGNNSVFGQSGAGVTSSIFGQALSSSKTNSTFGQATTSGENSSPFGQNTSTGTGSIFGQTAGTSGNAGGLFGSPPQSGSVFGGQSSFAQTPKSSSNSVFGNSGQASSSSIFGGGSASTQPMAFGGNQGNSSSMFTSNFNSQNAGNLFSGGTMFGGLGKQPNKEDASKNVFGNVKSETNSQSSIFGGANSSPFGSNIASSSGGAFTPVKSEASSSFVIGSGSAFGSPPSFGDPNKNRNVFGGGPVFGGGATFGGSPVLGGGGGGGGPSGPSGTSVFGSSTSAFSSGSSGSGSGFGNFASSGGATFGSLAGNAGTSNQPQTGSSEPTGFGQLSRQASGSGLPVANALGGSSFMTWRS